MEINLDIKIEAMEIFMRKKWQHSQFMKSDDQTNICNYRVAANITETQITKITIQIRLRNILVMFKMDILNFWY